ncbi:glucosyltransferase [Syncephalis fuscata]|nr:glucosyltransferase [Syncephalis fuscata]
MARKGAGRQTSDNVLTSNRAGCWIQFLTDKAGESTVLPTILLIALLVRWVVSLGPYSGEAIPPVFGDYEAQRHWMEITLHLPPSQWYFYDLSYWGLDYPPLTAYVSWLCGFVGSLINPTWFVLDKSRGIETPESRVFMRTTVIVLDYAIYIPAIVLFIRTWLRDASRSVQYTTLFILLLQPSLILVDHGHFQYNSVMLGLSLLAVVYYSRGRYLLGSVYFCLSLMFKQMALYYSPAIFFFLLGKCFRQPRGFSLFIQLGLTVAVTFALNLLPFAGSIDTLRQVFVRLFPVARGLYEDKVANVWCAISIVVKLRDWYSKEQLAMLSTFTTLLAFMPACINVFRHGSRRHLVYAMANSALAFFLFSFQVHEKTILLPLLPITLLIVDEPVLVSWFTNVAVFSMYPLLRREGLTLQVLTGLALWNWLFGQSIIKAAPQIVRQGIWITYGAMSAIFILDHIAPVPARLPHIYIMLNILFSTACFSGTLVYLYYRQFTLNKKELAHQPKRA